jgi:hypothetical protein
MRPAKVATFEKATKLGLWNHDDKDMAESGLALKGQLSSSSSFCIRDAHTNDDPKLQ